MTYFRKILTVLGASALVLLGSWGMAFATTTLIVQQGGTGATTFTSSNLLYGAGTNPIGSVATTSVTCTGSTTCTTFTAIGSSPITINTSGGSGTVTQVNTTWPVIGGPFTTTGTLSFGGLSTSSPIAAGGAILYATGVNTLASTATSTLTGTGPISVSNAPYIIGASGAVVSCATASGSTAGCLGAADFSKFNSATTTFTSPLTYTAGTNAVTLGTVPINKGGTNATSYTLSNGLVAYDGTSLVDYTGYTLTSLLLSATNATTTQLTSGSTNFYVDPTGHITAKDTVNGWSGVLSPTRSFVLETGTTTTWTASTTGSAYTPFLVMPFAGTLRTAKCSPQISGVNGSFIGVNVQVNGSNATPSYFIASSTIGTESFSAGNTFTAGQVILANYGTTTTATATSVSCTFSVTETP